MAKVPTPAIDAAALLDLLLLQQAERSDLSSRKDRRESRDRLQALFYDLQAAIRPDMTLEIGAFDAGFSARMAKKGIQAHAFEANPYNFRRFGEPLSKFGPMLTYHHCAIGDVDGEVTFEIKTRINGQDVAREAGNNSLLKKSDDQGDIEYETVTVPSLTLESFLTREKLIDHGFSAWIDVEGALSKVIGGFGSALKNCHSVIVELEELPYWEGQMLFDEAIRWFVDQGFLPVARDFESRHQFNVVFVKVAQLKTPKVRLVLARYFSGNGESRAALMS